MSNKYVNLLAFLIVVLVYSLPLYGGMIWSQSYIKKNADKPGLAEIRKIAQENNLKHSEVSNALRPPRKGAAPLIGIMAGQAVLVGFTLLIFGFIRRIISGLSKQKTNGAQQGVAGYAPQVARPQNANVVRKTK